MELITQLQPGIYRHYKGQNYQVFNVVTHSETREALVVYRCLYGDYSWWVRPLTMFTETVAIADELVPRFRLIQALATDIALPDEYLQ